MRCKSTRAQKAVVGQEGGVYKRARVEQIPHTRDRPPPIRGNERRMWRATARRWQGVEGVCVCVCTCMRVRRTSSLPRALPGPASCPVLPRALPVLCNAETQKINENEENHRRGLPAKSVEFIAVCDKTTTQNYHSAKGYTYTVHSSKLTVSGGERNRAPTVDRDDWRR